MKNWPDTSALTNNILEHLTRNTTSRHLGTLNHIRRTNPTNGIINKSVNDYKSSKTALNGYQYGKAIKRIRERNKKRAPSLSFSSKLNSPADEYNNALFITKIKKILPKIPSKEKPSRNLSRNETPRRYIQSIAGMKMPVKVFRMCNNRMD